MKQSLKYKVVSLSLALLLTSCASYNATSLRSLSPLIIQQGSEVSGEGIVIVAKAFDGSECREYLDRDVLAVGFQPVQLYIQNNSDKPYIFLSERVSLPCATAKEVSDKVHTSTIGRVAAYAAGSLFIWPLIIPAVVDGIMSSDANTDLDTDFLGKIAVTQTIFPQCSMNKIIFVPVQQFESKFTVTMIEGQSNQPKLINVTSY